jgi:bacterioferritin-associated ferredoxin
VIFCHCAVVGDREVADAIEAGANTVASVCKATGAGQQCGTCIFSVRRVLCDHQARDVVQNHVRAQVQATTANGVDVAAS